MTTSLYAAGSYLVQYAHTQCAFIHTRVGPGTTSQKKAPPLAKKYHVSTKSTTSYDTYTTFKNAHYFSNHTASPSKTPHLSRNVHHPSIISTTTTKTLRWRPPYSVPVWLYPRLPMFFAPVPPPSFKRLYKGLSTALCVMPSLGALYPIGPGPKPLSLRL